MVLELFTTVILGKRSIKAEVGQEHLNPQGSLMGRGIGQQHDPSSDSHGQAQNANLC